MNAAPSRWQRYVRDQLIRQLGKQTGGVVTLIEADQRWEIGSPTDSEPLRATVRVAAPRFYSRVALAGSIGAGESYMDGDWETDDLTTLIRILVRDGRGEGLESGLARVGHAWRKWSHRLRPNTRSGSQKNISAHYDLGNEFFEQILDPTMMYSCAIFEGSDPAGDTPGLAAVELENASRHKIDLICRKVGLKPGMRVVEIGTGWGGFALHAAEHYGCDVVTTTISQRQYEFASARVRAAGLDHKISLLKRDYRELPDCTEGKFDALVSIEMIEAVGHQFLGSYFETCSRLLKPDGQMLIQAILIPDQVYEQYRKGVDFIQRYIFPGGCLPSVEAILRSIAARTDLRLSHLQEITPHYAETLRRWRRALDDRSREIKELGFGDDFERAWHFYFSYCEGGFAERAIETAQLLFRKPANNDAAWVPQG